MKKLRKGELIELSNGITYVCIATMKVDEHDYCFISPKDEDKYFVGELVEKDGKQSFKIIEDERIFNKIQQYFNEHPETEI